MEKFDYKWFKVEKSYCDDEWNYITSWSNIAGTNKWSGNNGCEDNEYSDKPLFEPYDKDNDMLKHSNEPPCDLYKILSCETTKPSNSEILSNMLGMMEQMRKMLQEIYEALPPKEEFVQDVPNLDLEDPYIIVDHPESNNSSQQELATDDHGDELNMSKVVSDLINVETNIKVDVAIDVKVEVTTNMKLKLILNKSVKEPIHFLAIAENVPVKEIDEFYLFSSKNGNKS
ncbi:hypothetical protein PVK06_004952 [Gossypium arboreum]|uniref:Uncharacterized protein n=1 Tax=Gossypium arboreum TaxID=29729 RepID=A0ABR0QTE5_GOSAR|nr:hypothetical protein PVK06_004952 [Gossypium arboreum]